MAHHIELRQRIIDLHNSGKSLKSISIEEKIPYSSVKRIWQSYKKQGKIGIALQYHNCGPQGVKHYRAYRLGVWLKRLHPTWGAPFIRLQLTERYKDEYFPSVRTFQKWFRRAGLSKISSIDLSAKSKLNSEVKSPHDCWQIDAKENIELLDGTRACYLTTIDVKSGGILAAPIFFKGKNQPSNTIRSLRSIN